MDTFDLSFYKGKKVFVTGHTGFKGSWLCKILANAGAVVTGYSLNPPTSPSLFEIANAKKPKTEKQIRKWLADPYTDSAEYRIWGNGICLANAFFVLAGIAWCAGLEE